MWYIICHKMSHPWILVAACALALSGCAPSGSPPNAALGSAADREAMVRDIVAKTMARTAWSPYTAGRPERTFPQDAEALIPEFRAATTDHALLLALIKLSNLRHDRHLSVELVDGGLKAPEIEAEAPIRFRTDYGTPGQYTIFVADYARGLERTAGGTTPAVGDVLTAVNGVAVLAYAERMEPFIRYSTADKLWWETAASISRKSWRFAPDLYAPGHQVRYTLRRADGTSYDLTLDYQPSDRIEWAGHAAKRYEGFTRILETPSFDAYVHDGGARLVLLDWRRFARSVPADIDRLMALAQEKSLLDHAVFFDGTTSGGGARGAYALARLAPRRFKTTLGNLRFSYITDAFVADVAREGESPLLRWLEGVAAPARARGDAYSPSAPFKLAEAEADAEGMMGPAPVHFRGGLAAAFSPFGGSHLDQFAAMVIDNRLGYTVGMKAGGYSNTWEWTETLRLPGSGRPVAAFMWNIGHTLRPNGEILEGNGAAPDDPLPMTRDNFQTYHRELIQRVLAHFARRSTF